MKGSATEVIETAVNISVQNSSVTVLLSGTVKGNVWSGQRGKNRSELSYCQAL